MLLQFPHSTLASLSCTVTDMGPAVPLGQLLSPALQVTCGVAGRRDSSGYLWADRARHVDVDCPLCHHMLLLDHRLHVPFDPSF